MLFFNMIKHLKNKPEIDWTGVANDSGFKNAETAKAGIPRSFDAFSLQPFPTSSCLFISAASLSELRIT